jgi:hypothetical protein
MKGDFTRITFNPGKRYTNVLKQQGRVDLDADWNEQSAIDTYLDRLSRMDLSGVESGAPSLKPGFEVTLAAGGTDYNISAGRFYAKGIICELFQPTTYLTQPFLPNPAALVAPMVGRTDLVYLDVWQRHITAIEDPSIKEIALGGPDTTTRLQTIFQIRISPGVGNVDCPSAPLPDPSGGLMSSSLVPVPPEDDLCLIGATGGFRGLENRLYRVEVHVGGPLGTATFKWSRDNGSVVFPISEFVAGQPTKIRVTRLGRDQVLSLHEGDWVEVLDDNAELSGTPGTMAQIQNIDSANRELTLSVAVSGSMTAHPKVRRWDQKSGPIATSATPIPLEDGIQVAFGGTNFKTGDFWMFAARATDGTIQQLTNQPPQGIEHVYAKLALFTWTSATTADRHDCRKIFPASGEQCCCCSVTVGDGITSKGDFNNIKDAIAALPKTDEFAEVCLLPGHYKLADPVVVARSNTKIRGCGRRSIIEDPNNSPTFLITGHDVQIETLFVKSARTSIQIRASQRVSISDCELQAENGFTIQAGATECRITDNILRGGIQVQDGSRDVLIAHNRIQRGRSPGIALGGVVGQVGIFNQEFIPETGIVSVDIRDNRIFDNRGSGICTFLREGNRSFGVDDVLIQDNVIRLNGQTREQAPVLGGIVLQHTSNLRVLQNDITKNGLEGQHGCGIYLSECSNIDIEGNSILDNGNALDVITANCVDFQVMTPGQGANPRIESDVAFTLMDQTGAVVPPSRIERRNFTGRVFTGLSGTPNVTIKFPDSDAVDVTFIALSKPSFDFKAFNTAGTQLDSHTITGSGAPQVVTLRGTGISRVDIVTDTPEYLILEFCRIVVPVASAPQGGIIAIVITTNHASEPAQAFPAGRPAIRVHNNVVNTPAGHSLLITAIGQVSVEGNSLTSNGALKQPGLEFVTPFAVAIYDFGVGYGVANSFALLFFLLVILRGNASGFEGSQFLFDGRVLFQGNQVAFRALNGTIEGGSHAFGIIGLDSCQIANNQFRAECANRVLGADLVALSPVASFTANAFSEIPDFALLSGFILGIDAIASLNQSIHCLFVKGTQREVDQANQVVITTLCPEVTSFMKAQRF